MMTMCEKKKRFRKEGGGRRTHMNIHTTKKRKNVDRLYSSYQVLPFYSSYDEKDDDDVSWSK